MCISVHRLDGTDIVYIAVAVQVQIRQHIRTAIEHSLKLHDAPRLRKSGGYGSQFQALVVILHSLRGNDSGRGGLLVIRSCYRIGRGSCGRRRFRGYGLNYGPTTCHQARDDP